MSVSSSLQQPNIVQGMWQKGLESKLEYNMDGLWLLLLLLLLLLWILTLPGPETEAEPLRHVFTAFLLLYATTVARTTFR